jgi:hypothetical protein
MIAPLMVVYLGGWILITTTALSAAWTLADRRRPPSLRGYALTSVLAGAIWPVLVVGAAEVGALLTYAKLRRA